MRIRFSTCAIAAAVLAIGIGRAGAQPREEVKEPLPAGAAQRFGVTRPILRNNPGVALMPPNYVDFLAPTMSGGVRRYSLETGKPLQKDGVVEAGTVVISADGKRAAVARLSTVTVVEVATGKILTSAKPPFGVVLAGIPGVSLSADGKILAYAGQTKDAMGTIIVWDVDRGMGIAQLDTAQLAPVHPVLSPDGKIALSHGPPPPPKTKSSGALIDKAPKVAAKKEPDPDMERAAQVWDVFGEKELFRARVSGMGGTVISAAFGPESDLLAVSAGDGPVELWDANTGKRLQTLLGRRGQGIKVAISTDGKTVASVDSTYDIQRWRTDGTPLGITKAPQEFMQVPISGLAFADKERVVGWATAAQFAIAWEAPSSKRLSPQMDHCAAIRTIAFPRDDKGALKEPLTSGNDGRCFRWDLATGSIGEEILFHPSRLPGEAPLRPVISLSPDGKYGYWQRPHVEIFDIPAGDDKFGIPPPTVPLSKSGFVVRQAAGKIVASSSQSPGKTTGTAVVWDVDRQKRVGEYDTPGSFDGSVPPSVMSPDGKWLVVSALTRNPQGRFAITFAPIELKTGKRLPHVDDDTIGVGRMGYAYLGDTSVLLTSSMGRLWTFDFKTGKVGPDLDTIVPRGEPPFGSEVAISPDGKLAAIGIVDEPFTRYGVRVYDWRNRKILATFVGHLGPVSTLHFSPDGSLLASGSQDTSVLLWDLRKLAKE